MGALLFSYTHPRYTWPRQYLSRIEVLSDYQTDPILVGNEIRWTSAAGYHFVVALKTTVAVWSQIAFTVDHLFDEGSSSIDCVLFPCFDGLTVSQHLNVNDHRLTLTVHPASSLSQSRLVSLPPAPGGFWLPVDP